MAKPSPLAEQCTATSKSSGQRCQIRVVGGGPCRVHGGNAPQVRVKREARILAAEAARSAPVTAADAADVMTSAMNDAHSLLQRLKVNMANGRLEASDLSALGEWVDRAGRLAKLVADAGIEERRIKIAEGQGALIFEAIERILAALGLGEEHRRRLPEVAPPILRAIGEAEVVR